MAAKLNVGVIGYGMSAKIFNIPFIISTPSLNLHSIVQRNPKPSDDASKDYPSCRIYRSATEMFADVAIDIIVVTTTPETHFSFAKSALEAGKHVLVEKPFVPTVAEAEALIEVSRTTGKYICVYQNRRWDSDFLTIKKLLKENALGRVVEYETHFDYFKPVRPKNWTGTLEMNQAGGVLYDLGTHLIDQAYTLFGIPSTVTAIFSNQRNDGHKEPDSITILLGYGANGPLVTVKAGVMSVETAQLRFWIRGTQGSYRKHHMDCQENQLFAGMRPGDEGYGVESIERAGTLVVLEDGKPRSSVCASVPSQTYGALYEEFSQAITNGDASAVPVKAEEARDVIRILEAAKVSAGNGRTVEL